MKDEMTRAEKSREAAIIVAAIEAYLEHSEEMMKDSEINEEIKEDIREDISETEEVLAKYQEIYDDNTGPSLEQMEDLAIKEGILNKEDVEKSRLMAGTRHALLDPDTSKS